LKQLVWGESVPDFGNQLFLALGRSEPFSKFSVLVCTQVHETEKIGHPLEIGKFG